MLHRISTVLTVLLALSGSAFTQSAPRKERVQFGSGQSSRTIRASIRGNDTIDYLVRAGAGQKLSVSLRGSNEANYFNVIAPGQKDAAMAMGESLENRMPERILPTEGDYVIRVFLVRAAARRNESSTFTLIVGLSGKPLPNSGAAGDRKIPGTAFHASTDVPAYYYLDSKLTKCKAYVQRRGTDGTATVELRFGAMKRRVLFVKGQPTASDSSEPFTYEREDDVTIVKFGDDPSERFEIPDVLLFGG